MKSEKMAEIIEKKIISHYEKYIEWFILPDNKKYKGDLRREAKQEIVKMHALNDLYEEVFEKEIPNKVFEKVWLKCVEEAEAEASFF